MLSVTSIPALAVKLASARIAATVFLASLIFLAISGALFYGQHRDQFAQVNWRAQGGVLPKVIAILNANASSKTLVALVTLSMIFVTSFCFLVVELLRLLKTALKELGNFARLEAKKKVRFYRQRERQ